MLRLLNVGVFIVLTYLHVDQASGFTPKTLCLVDRPLGEEGEYEGEEMWNSGMARAHAMEGGPEHGMHHGHMDSEDYREMMGLDEAEGEGEGHGQEHEGGYGAHGGRRYQDEDGEWEDAKRRKRRRRRAVMSIRRKRQGMYGYPRYRSPHYQDRLVGKLNCEAGSMIHVLNVTLGYTGSRYCYPAYQGCMASSSTAKQIIHCQGNTGTCDVTIRRHFMSRCGHQVNFAKVVYECIPGTKRVTICSNTNSDITGGLVVTSPSYPVASTSSASTTGDIVTCECTLRAVADSTFEMEYLRTHMSGTANACDGDMFLIERPDIANQGQYLLEREFCGHNVSTHVPVRDNIIRLTFLGGAPLTNAKSGFISKFKALTSAGTAALFHVSCEGTPPGGAPLPTIQAPVKTTAKPISGSAYANRLLEWIKARGRTLPPSFNPSNLPSNFLNMSREQLQRRISQARAQSVVQGASFPQESGTGTETGDSGSSKMVDFTQSPGVLSGVVASLAAVIAIMLAIGGLVVYRRRERKKKDREEAERYGTTSSAGEPWYHSDVIDPGDGADGSSSQNRRKPSGMGSGRDEEIGTKTVRRNDPIGAAREKIYKIVSAGKAKLGSRSQQGQTGNVPNVYSVASSVPDQCNVTGITKAERQGRSPPSHSSTGSDEDVPLPPPRRKRKEQSKKQNGDNLQDDGDEISVSPYDNAADSRQPAQVMDEISDTDEDEECIVKKNHGRPNRKLKDDLGHVNKACVISDNVDDGSDGEEEENTSENEGNNDHADEISIYGFDDDDEAYSYIDDVHHAMRNHPDNTTV